MMDRLPLVSNCYPPKYNIDTDNEFYPFEKLMINELYVFFFLMRTVLSDIKNATKYILW